MGDLRRLWGYFWRYRARFIAAILCAIVVALAATGFTTMFIPIYETILTPDAVTADMPASAGADAGGEAAPRKQHILSLVRRWFGAENLFRFGQQRAFLEVPLLCVLLFLIKGIFAYVSAYLMDTIALRAIMDLRRDLYRKIVYQAMAFYSRYQTGELISRVTNDVTRLQSTSARQIADLVQFSLVLFGQLALMVYYDWRLSIICGVIMPLVIYPVVRFGSRLRKVALRSQTQLGEVTDRLHETITGARIVTGFNMQEYEAARFSAALGRLYEVDRKGVRALALSPPVMELVGAFAGAVLIWYAGVRIRAGTLQPGVLLTFLTALALSYVIIKRLARINNALQQALGSARRVFELIDCEETIRDAPDAMALERFEREIRFRHVGFAYGDRPVLEAIDFSLPRGKMVALVGPSGAGKTTLINLLPRLFDVTSGSIEIDGVDIRRYTTASLRDRIAVVTQEIILFSDSARNNIAYGRLDAPQADVERAARAALAHEFILELPQGYDTPVGERGHFLSVGQRQRLAIARAVLSDSPILILDEATSALDTESERLVQVALDNLMAGRTVVVIAHRLSTIRRADEILVVDRGRIVERGDHDALLAADGLYRKLHDLQFDDPQSDRGAAAAT